MEMSPLLDYSAPSPPHGSREQLLTHIFDIAGEYVNDNTLTVYMKRLREKLEEDPVNPQLIRTVRGIGYLLGGEHV